MNPKEIMLTAAKALDGKKAQDLRVLAIGDLSILADYFVLATGTSTTQVKALADEVDYQLSRQGVEPARREGYGSAAWILLDYGSVVVHVFQPESREFYNLDKLWSDGKPVDVAGLLKGEEAE